MEKESWKNWKIDSLIGEGKFSKVYKIYREDMGCIFYAALKVIDIPASDHNILKELVGVLVLMSTLKDAANILGYDDYEVVPLDNNKGWKIFLRMELQTALSDYSEKNALSHSEVVKLGIDICKALEICEGHGIIHRNIKPENIFVSASGDFLLGDYGASELEKASESLPENAINPYMPPEVFKNRYYDLTADIYSLGIVMYRCLNNNRAPFFPLFQNENGKIPKMDLPANAKKGLSDIVLKACAFLPSERYQSAKELREELERYYYRHCTTDPKTKKYLYVLLSVFLFLAVAEAVILFSDFFNTSSNKKNNTKQTTSATEYDIHREKEIQYTVLTDRIKRKYRTDSLSGIISIKEGYISALTEDGTLLTNTNGDFTYPDKTDESKRIICISQGNGHVVCLRNDGSVSAYGNNEFEQCNVSNWKNIVAVSAGAYFTTGLKSDGTVVAVGNNSAGQCYVSGLENIVGISAGYTHLTAIKANNYAVAIGSNHFSESDVFSWNDVKMLSASEVHTAGLKSDGTVVASGANAKGQCDVYDWKNITAVSAGNDFTVGIKSDGTVISTDNNKELESWSDIVAVCAGNHCVAGVKSDGTIVCTGNEDIKNTVSEWSLW